MSKRWINTKVEFEWDGTQYIETYTEGYWYEGELASCMPANATPEGCSVRTGQSSGEIDVTILAPAYPPGETGDNYDVRYDVDSEMKTPTTISDVAEADDSEEYEYTITGLSSSTTYYVQARHIGVSGGPSPWVDTEPESATTLAGVPDAPGAPTATSVDFETIALSWSAVSSATSYRLYWAPGEGNPTSNETTISSGTTYTLGSLLEARSYSFRLKAGNSVGYSGYGTTLTQSTKWEDEGTISLSNNLATSNYITWTVPTSDAGGDESKLYGEINDTTPDVLISTQSGTGAKNYTHTSLTPSGVYSYQLRIYLANNNGFYTTNQVSTVTNPADIPATPGTPTVSAKTTSAITFAWSSVSGATSYKLYFGTDNPPTNINDGTQTTTYPYAPYSSLSVATAYHFRIKASNSSGDSGYSNTQTTDTITDAGGQPSNPTSVTPVSQTVSWTNPSGTATAYLYGGTSSSPTVELTSGAGLTSYSHVSLTPGTTYYYRTRTKTTNHDGFFSSYSSDRSGDTSVVSAPTNLAYTANSTSQITITWDEPTYSTRTYIEYYYSSAWRTVNPDGGSYLGDGVESWVLTSADTYDKDGDNENFNLIGNKLFQFRMRAYQTTVLSSWSSTLNSYTLPNAPVLTATAISDSQIDLSWTNPGGSALAETYTLEYTNGTDIQTGVSDFAHSDEALTQNTSYSYRVFTITNAGTGAVSSTASATTQTGPDPVAGDNLGWGNLGHATGNANNTTTSNMNTMSGGTSEVSARDFFAGGIASTTLAGSSTIPFLGSETLSMTFSNIGSSFMSRIAGRQDQFTWTSSNTNVATVTAGADYIATINGIQLDGTCTITCVWDANFNDTHDGITSARTATKNITVTFLL